jgi:hypothetical protein
MHATQLPRLGKSPWDTLDGCLLEVARQLLLALIRQARQNGRPAVPAASRPQR